MTNRILQDPDEQAPAPDSDSADAEALRALAARYFDLWQENWAAFLDPNEAEPP